MSFSNLGLMVFEQLSLITLLNCISPTFFFSKQGNVTQDPPDTIQDEGLSGVNGTQNTTITIPAIVKVRNTHQFFHSTVMIKLAKSKSCMSVPCPH